MEKVKKVFAPDKDKDGSEVMFGTPEPKNVHPSDDPKDQDPKASVENQASQAPEAGMGTNQITAEGSKGVAEGGGQGEEAGMGKLQ